MYFKPSRKKETVQSSFTSIYHVYVYILTVMVTTTLRDTTPYRRKGDTFGELIVKEEEVHHMKKHILVLAVITALSIGMLSGQASASSNHIVESGDTLWDIARDNNISVEDLLTWNKLDSILIYPSQELQIEKKVEIYVVKKGDTLFDIAEDHDISLKELMTWNNVSGHLIYPDDQLALDKPTKSSPQANVKPPQEKKPLPTPPVAKAKVETKVEKKVEKKVNKPVPPAAKTPKPSPPATKEMSVTATAYTAYCEGCSGITYTGIDLRSNPNQKVIAVDPSIIPLGSRVWVEGYGEAIAGDIGGAIKGNIIDVFLEDRQDALNWGRKTVTIKILE